MGKLIDISRTAAEREELIAKAEREKNREGRALDALLVIDCDSLKQINDTHGHLTGDRVLEHIAYSLTKFFRGTDYVGRIGGDEFAVFMKDVPSGGFVREKCAQLNKAIEHKVDGAAVSLSVGVALIDQTKPYTRLRKINAKGPAAVLGPRNF